MLPAILLLGVAATVADGPRWLRLCDKGPDEPARGTRAWQDAPERRDLLDSLRSRGWKIRNEYRWENLVSAVPVRDGATLPTCVEDAGSVARGMKTPLPAGAAGRSFAASRSASVDEFTASLRAVWDSLGIETAHERLQALGRSAGEGIRIAFMDGFFDPTHPVLQGAAVVDRWDFVDDRSTPWDSTGYDMHGTQTSGLVVSSWDRLPGVAPAAGLLLYRTENDTTETPVEEDNLAAAIVRACDSGARVISTSLGYRWQDYADQIPMHPDSAFDGRTLVASRAATEAARRDVVVVVAAGNEADRFGPMSIDSPADADSVLTVGAVDATDQRCSFSSFGPTWDGRRKPDVAAYGCSVPVAGYSGDQRTWGIGTSFSTPLVAGMVVLARQLLPGMSAPDIVQAFRAAGNLSATPNDFLGWGVPSLVRISTLRQILTSSRAGSPLPRWWSLSQGSLRFAASGAQTQGSLGVELRTLDGRILLRWEGRWSQGAAIWGPDEYTAQRPQLVVARWWGDYGAGSVPLLVLP
jgi:hypothetical protein